MDNMSGSFEEIQKQFNAMPLHERIAFGCNVRRNFCTADSYATKLSVDGYLSREIIPSVNAGENDCYVYVWKHAWGEPFYVGSGRGNRWTTKAPRCDAFYYHLDKGDAVVYKLVDGLTQANAKRYEDYVSVTFSAAGIELANHDNNVFSATEERKERKLKSLEAVRKWSITSKVDDAMLSLVTEDSKLADYRVTARFLEKYGVHYFSEHYVTGAKAN